ncbi:NAD(P)/FAD-dependent oxidoreductase [Desulfoferrobacter suflitae]|uniref:NAD(P)/FAD-dependent oxidoreductase n=1 Tax=Desulfoferrobacter suflitae TaxID=2865782 RepID=UPI002164B368|nr:FAD-dependent oxidoreductase [Desulfoferrobacter suflitae]MCK8601385.1 FAD-dependent oxidoreductase [Desulfoferrobacter suflitae]
MKHVIIGNGIAGISAAEMIRQMDADASMTLIGDESFPPYCRPMISMVLEGSVGYDRLPVRGADFYDRMRIQPILGNRVTALDVDNRTVSVQGEHNISYDKLLIATGADPRPIKANNLHLKNIFFMRTAEHVRAMLEAVPSARRALVLGGGLVGFKAAYGLLHRGIPVTMLIRSGYPLALQVDPRAGQMIQDELVARGLDVRVEVHVIGFDGNSRVRRAFLSDGTELDCDMVVIGKGVTPALSFVPKNIIQVDLGILVNRHLETSVPGIYAAGDVAELIDLARNTRWVNAIWPEAVAQGRVAGMNMVGRKVAYKGSLSRNVIRIFGLDVMTAGIVNAPHDGPYEVIARDDPLRKNYRKLVFLEDRLVGMTLVNHIQQGGMLIAMMQSGRPVNISREKILSASFNYRQLIR